MRRFHSYGPVNANNHFAVKRDSLVRSCVEALIGGEDEGGHFFTIWAPRQSGKTWLARQAIQAIRSETGEKFHAGIMSMQGVVLEDDAPEDALFPWFPRLFGNALGIEPEPDAMKTWRDFIDCFHKKAGIFDRPVVLFVDEFDGLPPKAIDRLFALFREMYLDRDNYVLHGLALVGVSAVLGVDSLRGSPFNVQRSLRVPNFSFEETSDLFRQYETESGQCVDAKVVRAVYDATCGQPGLVGWFGELLTEKYNPGSDRQIDMEVWDDAYLAAIRTEWNNTLLNLVKKARGPYMSYVVDLFAKPDMPFSIRSEWCSYLYLNGIVSEQRHIDAAGQKQFRCRFSSPFVQACLYEALGKDIVDDRLPILALDPLDDLSDVFESESLDLAALLGRYKDYLKRLKAAGLNPWKDQPRRADLRLTEAAGHFHLYFWLQNAVGSRCAVSPEFPTGNGKVDLHLQCGEKRGIVEVKSFIDASQARAARTQAARYAVRIGLKTAVVALFVPTGDETVLEKLSAQEVVEGAQVRVMAIGWA